MIRKGLLMLFAGLALAACERPVEQQNFRTGKVQRRDIVVSVEAAGVIEPFLTVEVKSKASGEILKLPVETGYRVEAGTLLVQIDERVPRNQLAQAKARLEAALARRSIAEAQSKRAKSLLESRTINDVDYEQTVLELANAKADVVSSQVDVENARIALDDTDVRAPIDGTIIEKLVEKGQVISSPTMDVGGGTLLLKMADLSKVQVKTLVNETDIGKIRPGLPVTVTVTSFPNQPFDGEVLKVEPQAMAEQTVTTFSVLITLDNASGLLRPGMNADVAIRVAEARDVLAVPTAALRTTRDVPVAAQLVGLNPEVVREQLGQGGQRPPGDTAASGNEAPADAAGGRPAGRAPAAQASGRPASGRPSGRPASGSPDSYAFANRYWVFVKRGETLDAVNVETGLTDLDYSEVIEGLEADDTVVLLPSSGLVQSQQRLQERMRQFTALPGMSGNSNGRER